MGVASTLLNVWALDSRKIDTNQDTLKISSKSSNNNGRVSLREARPLLFDREIFKVGFSCRSAGNQTIGPGAVSGPFTDIHQGSKAEQVSEIIGQLSF